MTAYYRYSILYGQLMADGVMEDRPGGDPDSWVLALPSQKLTGQVSPPFNLICS